MNDFISLQPLAAPLDGDGLRRLAIHACLSLHRVRWRRCYLALDGERMLCWYQAPDAESVRLVLRQLRASDAPLWPVRVAGGLGDEGLDDTGARVLVELALDDAEAPAVPLAVLTRVLAGSGARISRSFLIRDPGRLLCLVAGGEPDELSRSLDAAGVRPRTLWGCIEHDPEPGAPFAAQMARGSAPSSPPSRQRRLALTAALPDLDAIIIGAGLSGICALERFRRMGLAARVYESGSEVGGVWYWNRYPGARVDSEIHTYAFAFSDALVRDWAWQELFAPQPEIARYLSHVVERFDLRRHIRFDTRVLAAAYDDRRALWRVETDKGDVATARFLIGAAGTLSMPLLPEIPGMDDFRGASFHTARWPQGVTLAGKRVGVIGTGASGVQVIQTIAPEVAQLSVFQRTPTYCIPQRNRPLSASDRAAIRRDWPRILATCRTSFGGFLHTFDPRSGLAVSPAEREAKFEALWQQAGFAFWFSNFADLMMNFEVNEHACDFLRRKIRGRVHDPETARRLLPDHPFGTKRVPLENGYYETYDRANVTLVDLRETPIERISPAGIRTSRGEHALDIIVYATGFDAGGGAFSRIDIRGLNGLSLAEKWRAGPQTFLGLLVGGFPNLLIVNGPHNAAALCNAGRCIEQNVDWIARCISRMRRRGERCVTATAEAEQAWTQHVHDVAEASVLATMKDSWYFGAPGRPRIATIYAAGAGEYRKHCEAVASAGYAGLAFG
ncbi:NAD(P)-binding domain-containing protein [Halomonas sp. BM-2019]|uniref:NAD(P)-binding domain-containing protein n=1 Tax=Halomonas sp. BM-2019 TaxID=2811227 RepID=UPI001B3C1D3C|nr:MAG: NAD(P)-binding domain-containing protein [Halomonas sp. BM-2019]